jgi:hypothetical protein
MNNKQVILRNIEKTYKDKIWFINKYYIIFILNIYFNLYIFIQISLNFFYSKKTNEYKTK